MCGCDFMRVFAHQHEAQAHHDFAFAVGGDGTAADFRADGHVGHVADVESARRPSRRLTMFLICSMFVVRPRPWTSNGLSALAHHAAADVLIVLLDGLASLRRTSGRT